ncbi:hypothetical protein B0T24DRAFT_632565 [Lasiosphaeria ovina]|uniref:Uncharacterized protein n=1 Tax=Lasiosphaeria ovina TaxID=92902 RepID=A0AAE0N3E2_9PEZI|nr:hypothetical protein B0T24DRAFT_632565 [Lasiosphaeria ovina]
MTPPNTPDLKVITSVTKEEIDAQLDAMRPEDFVVGSPLSVFQNIDDSSTASQLAVQPLKKNQTQEQRPASEAQGRNEAYLPSNQGHTGGIRAQNVFPLPTTAPATNPNLVPSHNFPSGANLHRQNTVATTIPPFPWEPLPRPPAYGFHRHSPVPTTQAPHRVNHDHLQPTHCGSYYDFGTRSDSAMNTTSGPLHYYWQGLTLPPGPACCLFPSSPDHAVSRSRPRDETQEKEDTWDTKRRKLVHFTN